MARSRKKADWTSAEWNPRRISPEALAGLRRSLATFGDLSGFVVNERTGSVICGHARREALGEIDLSAAVLGPERRVELGHPGKRFTSRERAGHIELDGGARFSVRVVDWPPSFEKAANVAANSPALQGEFTEGLSMILEELRASEPEISDAMLFDSLLSAAPAPAGPVREFAVRPPPPMTWALVGIPTVRFIEISEAVERIASVDGVMIEITSSDAGADAGAGAEAMEGGPGGR